VHLDEKIVLVQRRRKENRERESGSTRGSEGNRLPEEGLKRDRARRKMLTSEGEVELPQGRGGHKTVSSKEKRLRVAKESRAGGERSI